MTKARKVQTNFTRRSERIVAPVVQYVWKTSDGRYIPVDELETDHLRNCLAYVKKAFDARESLFESNPRLRISYAGETYEGYSYQAWINIFTKELLARTKIEKQNDLQYAILQVKTLEEQLYELRCTVNQLQADLKLL